MSEIAAGIGVRNPIERIKEVTDKFSVLISEIQNADMPVVFQGYDDGTQAPGTFRSIVLKPGETAEFRDLDESELRVGAVRDYTGKFPAQPGIYMLNEPEIREATADKSNIGNYLPDDSLPTRVLGVGENLRTLLLDFETGDYVVKPQYGLGSKGVEIINSPGSANKTYDIPMVVQPRIDTTHMPDQIQGIGDFYKAMVASRDAPKELRLFGYRHNNDDLDLLPVLKVSHKPDIMDAHYFTIIDPDSVPAESYDLATKSIKKLAEYAGVQYIYFAIDFVYSEDKFVTMEINTKEPAVPNIKNQPDGEDELGKCARLELAYGTRKHLAKQLIRLAKS